VVIEIQKTGGIAMNRICPFEGTRWGSYYLLLRIALVLFTASVSSLIAVAQNGPPAPKRLTIGVALEAGGALGLAHIGVIRWFEQHHIPIDYIAGNSMGGLVGGMYATGKSPDELEQLSKEWTGRLLLGAKPHKR
jgi:NTE family protein